MAWGRHTAYTYAVILCKVETAIIEHKHINKYYTTDWGLNRSLVHTWGVSMKYRWSHQDIQCSASIKHMHGYICSQLQSQQARWGVGYYKKNGEYIHLQYTLSSKLWSPTASSNNLQGKNMKTREDWLILADSNENRRRLWKDKGKVLTVKVTIIAPCTTGRHSTCVRKMKAGSGIMSVDCFHPHCPNMNTIVNNIIELWECK